MHCSKCFSSWDQRILSQLSDGVWLPHFRTFCEQEENKLTTFSTWTIVSNESNIIFQQHLCLLGQLRRKFTSTRSSNEEETNKKYSLHLYCQQKGGELYR